MKLSHIILAAFTLTPAAHAAKISVNVPAGMSYVRAESSFHSSGCSNSTTFYAVVRDANGAYIASHDLTVKDVAGFVKELEESFRRPPLVTCMAWVKHTQAAAFVHSADRAETITLDFPASIGDTKVDVSVTAVR